MAKEKEITTEDVQEKYSFDALKSEVLNDYRLVNESREASLLGRREVLTGKAKFGIFGDGKEVAQVALAKQFENGDFRSGYYRDQTWMMASGILTLEAFFAQLYANTDIEHDPSSCGRQMNCHFATRSLNEDGSWKNLTEMKNTSSDISPTAGQMPRLLGLALASKAYRNNPELQNHTQFSIKGNEIAWGSIGDASTSEGLFWETINAAGVLQVPMVMSVWDDGHGISVPKKYQTTKESISDLLIGFEEEAERKGFKIIKVKGWNYPELRAAYAKAADIARTYHTPCLVHVEEVTQPQGHSTSGSHERYKTKERLEWETEYDCIAQMKKWILNTDWNDNGIDKKIATEEELKAIEKEAKKTVREAKNRAWKAFQEPIKQEIATVTALIDEVAAGSANTIFINKAKDELLGAMDPTIKTIVSTVRKVLRIVRAEDFAAKHTLLDWYKQSKLINEDRFNSYLYSCSPKSALNIEEVPVQYDENAELVDGRIVLRENFDQIFAKYPEVIAFGEDSGKIGGVNQGYEGLQAKHGEHRLFDTGIREATIIGQGIGMAMRGLRPIAEIQYLDYLLYAVQIMSDDLATLLYRTKGGQKAPLIIRTRGHRFEGIWHAGSPMGMILNACRGIYVCVPRNMTKAAGFYNAFLESDDPVLIIEPLNGYRTKEVLPTNLTEFTTPIGIPEVLNEGNDVTLVTYGSCVKVAQAAAEQLREVNVSVEVIDVQTLLPFDINHMIVESIKKTNRIAFLDEDVRGGASAFMMQQVVEDQKGYLHLDSQPITISAKDHRPAYADDGDYFSKPSVEDVVEQIYQMMNEANPTAYPSIY